MTETAVSAELRRTPLNAAHRQLRAKMVPFGGWDMPVEYSGIVPEHRAVRTSAGLFDVSHMGEIEVRGPQALALIQHTCSNDASKLAIGQAHYTGLLTAQATFVDDLLVHKVGDDHYFLVVNASNQEQDFAYLAAHNPMGAQVSLVSDDYAQIAIQGPRALEILQPLTTVQLAPIHYYWFTTGKLLGIDAIVARTGYTGEDGFEIYFAPAHAERVWTAILDAGCSRGLIPCGLGARNTLRLESAMALYGHEIDATTTPLEANLGWICKMSKPEFLGKEILLRQKAEGLSRRLVGFEMIEAGIARDGYPVVDGDRTIGHVTSGSPAPFLGKNIGMAYVPMALTAPGTEIAIQIRTRVVKARVVPTPFYRRPKT